MAKLRPSLAFSRTQAAFAAALRAEIDNAKLRGMIDPGMGPILFALEQKDMLTMSELAAAASVPKSTMTGVATRMEKRGIIRTAPDPRDRRGIVVTLTPKGRRLIPRVRTIEAKLDRLFEHALAGKDAELFAASLERLASALEPR